MMIQRQILLALPFLLQASHAFKSTSLARTTSTTNANAFTDSLAVIQPLREPPCTALRAQASTSTRLCRAQGLMTSLIEESQCFSTEAGAKQFGEACDSNVVYEDCYEPQPIVGKMEVTNHMLAKVAQRNGKGTVRIDRISDGDMACGFAWTWVTSDGQEEGLRGTTFVELNDSGDIQYVREIPEPIFKPGDATIELLKAVTKGAEFKLPKEYEQQTPTIANEVAKYLFLEVQGSSVDESMRLFDDNILYRDFNYEEILKGPAEVRKFIEDFSFPGIEFRPQKFDDGQDATCFTWEVVLEGAPETIKGISFYELSPETRKIVYVRDVPESAIKPPILGKLARQLRPGKSRPTTS